jgi:subtilase family serine protease
VVAIPPLDLQVSAIEVSARDTGHCVAGKTEIFATIKSSADGSVGEFVVRVKVDDNVIDTATIGGIASSSEKRIPMAPVEMKPGKHTVQAIVDPANNVAEENENNNSKTVEVECVGR